MSALKFSAPNAVSQWRVDTLLTKEPATIAWIDAVPAGSVLWDVGANIGIYSIYAASRGIDVVAIEPVPAHFAELCENIASNGLEHRIVPVCAALGAEPGIHRDGDGIAVPRLMFDDLAHVITREPTYIKIDTDGDDLAVLHGAFYALTVALSVIVEIDDRRDDGPAIRDWMETYGFRRTGRHICPLTPRSPIGMDHWQRL